VDKIVQRNAEDISAPFSHHPRHCRMLAVLHLNPMLLPAPATRSIAMLRNQTLEAEFASLAKQVRPNLALLEIAGQSQKNVL
jgi:hypothetical protein